MLSPSPVVGSNWFIWQWSATGRFSSSETYKHFVVKRNMLLHSDGSIIWKINAPQRVRLFLWLLQRNWILTNGERVRLGMIDDAHCMQCGETIETTIHVGWTRSLSNYKCRDWLIYNTFLRDKWYLPKDGWVKLNTDDVLSPQQHIVVIGGALCDSRASWLFDFAMRVGLRKKDFHNMVTESDNALLIDLIGSDYVANSNLSEAWTRSLSNYKCRDWLMYNTFLHDKWYPLEDGWVKLNTDGALSLQQHTTTIGGAFCDLRKKSFRKVVTKSDNALLIDLIGSGYVADSNLLELRLIHDLYKQNWQL
ncbi:hypothetical protein Goshw_006335, partial [Gossypium schwendimanii]|nr:hypothetical protein [Gossypium schwendimanii]